MKKDGTTGKFTSVVGICIKVTDYQAYDSLYRTAIKKAFANFGIAPDYTYYCTHDLSKYEQKAEIEEAIIKQVEPLIDRVHVIYTLFSKNRLNEYDQVNVYGRYSKKNKLKLSKPTRTIDELIESHTVQIFPGICAWKLSRFFYPHTTSYILDAYEGHVNEAEEEFEQKKFKTFVIPNGDCANPLISTSDILLDVLDRRLAQNRKSLLFENIRPALPEFGEKVLAYIIDNRDLPKITPVDKTPIETNQHLMHPVFWVFKADDDIDSKRIKESQTYRNLVDFAALKGGCTKLYNKHDEPYLRNDDYGVYHNTAGKETVASLRKFGIALTPFDLDSLVPKTITKTEPKKK
ncbi:MAG: hypothetical protein WC408_04385 [Candidatus Micrarchaeia archaeon]|jgi:hypothetical protein